MPLDGAAKISPVGRTDEQDSEPEYGIEDRQRVFHLRATLS